MFATSEMKKKAICINTFEGVSTSLPNPKIAYTYSGYSCTIRNFTLFNYKIRHIFWLPKCVHNYLIACFHNVTS